MDETESVYKIMEPEGRRNIGEPKMGSMERKNCWMLARDSDI